MKHIHFKLGTYNVDLKLRKIDPLPSEKRFNRIQSVSTIHQIEEERRNRDHQYWL